MDGDGTGGWGCLYIDGHVRVYNGHQTKLPRHYVSRQKLCLRATTDYWVNAMDGQPFFVINQEIDPGLLQVLENEIVPRLEAEIPAQPARFELPQSPNIHRFTMVFVREGYSPGFMKLMRDKGIACQTYHKYPGEDWPEEEFHKKPVRLVSDNIVEMRLAERDVFLGKTLWGREIRKLTESVHQTAIISTDYQSDCSPVAATMFARWSQENFFRYMRKHYNLDGDGLADYSTEEISETTKLVNPEYRAVDGKVRSHVSKLNRMRRKFGEIMLIEEIAPRKVEAYQQKKSALHEGINGLERLIEELKVCRKETPKHITIADLPKEDRFRRLGAKSKYLIDTIKMIAYRAETAMVSIIRDSMSRIEDARSLIEGIYTTEVDLIPDEEDGTLKVRLHQLANCSSGKTLQHLCNELNNTCTQFPGTNMRLFYELVS
ncbi:MAG: hypothetical protein KJ630_01745 [Proteobacteria bacterium]|nr:hypothetical protein [Pseudomonadota bacterium]